METEEQEAREAQKCIIVQTEDEFLAACGSPSGAIQVVQKGVKQRREQLLHRVLDGAEQIDVEMEAAAMGLERVAKVISTLDNSRDVKIDHSISAMALIGMFPVAKEVD
jgi:hypothetical protein